MTMKGGNDEHIEAVARRNAELYQTSPEQFKNKMLGYGWTESEIEQMIRVIKRVCRNED